MNKIILLFGIIFSLHSNKIQKKQNNLQSLIIGSWNGKLNSNKVIIVFNKNLTGKIIYNNKPSSFSYKFIKEAVIDIYNKKSNNYHLVKIINRKLSLRPYPETTIPKEDILVIDDIDFTKSD